MSGGQRSAPINATAQMGAATTTANAASHAATGTDWLRSLPGQTVAAIHLAMLPEGMDDPQLLEVRHDVADSRGAQFEAGVARECT